MPNPLSPFTYYRRHKRRAALLAGFIALVVAGLYLMMALAWAVSIESLRSNRQFVSKFSIVMPGYGNETDAAIMAQVRANPDVERVVPAVFSVGISLPEAMAGGTSFFNLLGLSEEDLPYVMARCGATLKEGRILQPRTNGIMLSEEVATLLNLRVGDIIHNEINPRLYSNIVDPLQVVAILRSDVRLGIMSLEYLSSHEFYARIPPRFLVMAREGREAAVDAFLRREIYTTRTNVWTLEKLNEELASEYAATYAVLLPVVCLVSLAVMLVVGAANRISLSGRLPELGILSATGRGRKWLTRWLTLETAAVAVVGWVTGVGLSWLILFVLKLTLFEPRGHVLRVVSLTPPLLVLTVPFLAIVFTYLTVSRILSRLDAVAVIERRELSLEKSEPRSPSRYSSRERSLPKPFAVSTFFARHRGRMMLMTGSMALMIMAVVLAVFVFTASHDASKASYGELSRVTVVGAGIGSSLDPAVVARIRAHPAVARVMPAFRQTMLSIIVPPFDSASIHPFAVYADDMAYLVDLFRLKLVEGRLPRPRTNELVIPEAVAKNRNLRVGDIIGDPDRPAYPGGEAFKTASPFVISGIFAKPAPPAVDHWLAFVSLEYVESHEAYGRDFRLFSQMVVAPKAGRKVELDRWLLTEVSSSAVNVHTYEEIAAAARQRIRTTLTTVALVESVIAVMAASGLAVLNYLYISQRQPEYGVLSALGYRRSHLVWRTVGETTLTTAASLGVTVFVCMAGLMYLRFGLFAPLGLSLNLLNLTPWLFTLPIPVAVLAAVTVTISRTLAKLDPVSIIERRTA